MQQVERGDYSTFVKNRVMLKPFLKITIVFFSFVSMGCASMDAPTSYMYSDWFTADAAHAAKDAKKIKKLSIGLCRDSVFPNPTIVSMGKLSDLNILMHRSGGFTYIPSRKMLFDTVGLAFMQQLKKLTIDGSIMAHFPYELSKLAHLEELNLVFCKISEFPSDLSSFKNLKTLNLSLNEITKMPDSIIFPSSLQTLVLNNNKLSDIPVKALRYAHIKVLDISNREGVAHEHIGVNVNTFSIVRKIEIINILIQNPFLQTLIVEADDCAVLTELYNSINTAQLKKKLRVSVNNEFCTLERMKK